MQKRKRDMFRALEHNEDWKYSQGNKPKSNVT